MSGGEWPWGSEPETWILVCVLGRGRRPGSGCPDISRTRLQWAYSFTRLLHLWKSRLLPAFKGDLRSWWQFSKQGLGQPPCGYPGAWHGRWEHTGLGTWLLSSHEQSPEMGGHVFSVHLCLGWRGEERREGDPKGFQALSLASRALRAGLPRSLPPEGPLTYRPWGAVTKPASVLTGKMETPHPHPPHSECSVYV